MSAIIHLLCVLIMASCSWAQRSDALDFSELNDSQVVICNSSTNYIEVAFLGDAKLRVLYSRQDSCIEALYESADGGSGSILSGTGIVAKLVLSKESARPVQISIGDLNMGLLTAESNEVTVVQNGESKRIIDAWNDAHTANEKFIVEISR